MTYYKYALAAAMIAASLTAHSQVLVSPNEAGGEIVLTREPCTLPGGSPTLLFHGFSFSSKGDRRDLCWYYDTQDQLIHVVFQGSSSLRVYRPSAFHLRGANDSRGRNGNL